MKNWIIGALGASWGFIFSVCGQEVVRDFTPIAYEGVENAMVDSLLQGKTIPGNYRLAAAIALSYYPELSHLDIEFREKSIRTSMAALPRPGFIFRSKSNRSYRIVINNNPARLDGALLHQIPFNAQVGVLAHELAHIVDYSERGIFKMGVFGFRYLFRKGRRDIERYTDLIVIQKGLGWQLHDFREYIMHGSGAPGDYLRYKESIYLMPGQIIRYFGEFPDLYDVSTEEENLLKAG
jgi:hypothetical protein